MNTTFLIAGREISTRIRTKSFLLSTLITVGIIVAVSFLPNIISAFEHPTTVATVGTSAREALASASSDAFEISELADESAARAAIADGQVQAALVTTADVSSGLPHYTLLTDEELSTSDQAALLQMVQAHTQTQLLAANGVNLLDLQQQLAQSAPEVISLGEQAADPTLMGIAFIVAMLLFAQLFGSGTMVAQGVVEEKASRVVEVLLAAVSPRQLLVGKVIGIGVVGLLQLVVFLAAGIIAVLANGTLSVDHQVVQIALVSVAWFVPGYLFYAFAYGAAGSMVSRQEEIGSTTTPLMLLIMGSYMASLFALQDINASWIQWLSVIPPFSALLMPMRIAGGNADLEQIGIAAVLLVGLTVVTALLGARIYQRSVLRTGASVKLRQALR